MQCDREAFERHFTATAYVVSGEKTLLIWHIGLRMWLPPGGHCEPNEDPVEAAVREAGRKLDSPSTVSNPPTLLRSIHRECSLPPQ